MAPSAGDRSDQFPKIEAKYGKPMAFWFGALDELGEAKYPDQISLLRERYGFSQNHANAVVMHHRGSTTSRRFDSPEAYFAALDATKQNTARNIFRTITKQFPDLELVIAWNQPMVRRGTGYVFGLSEATHHLLIAPWSTDVLDAFAPRLTDYKVNKKTIQVPVDWKVDATLLTDMVAARLAELD